MIFPWSRAETNGQRKRRKPGLSRGGPFIRGNQAAGSNTSSGKLHIDWIENGCNLEPGQKETKQSSVLNGMVFT